MLDRAGPLEHGFLMVSSKVLYKHKGTGNHILFYDSHWKHSHGMEQVRNCRSMACVIDCHCSVPAMQGQNYFRKDPEGQGEANASDCLSISLTSLSISLNSVPGYPRDVTVVSVVSNIVLY